MQCSDCDTGAYFTWHAVWMESVLPQMGTHQKKHFQQCSSKGGTDTPKSKNIIKPDLYLCPLSIQYISTETQHNHSEDEGLECVVKSNFHNNLLHLPGLIVVRRIINRVNKPVQSEK